jgi:class 3 adenylate cyclase/tetratricopeptide (TPR) repeat protein
VPETRRVVTALFADLVGSTALGERLDPEDFQEIVGGAVTKIASSGEELGGAVKEVAGDGVLALFGALASHEDDPERAVLAGLRIVERIDVYGREAAERWGIEQLAVRVGIETGLAVLGPARGVGSGYEARGDCLNTAARVQAEAHPGEVLVGPATCRLIEPLFEWGEPRCLRLKGKAEPVVARVAIDVGRAAERRRAPEGMQSPLVGRERELATLREAVDALAAGSGGVLLVTGEVGMGKTRLLAELREMLESAPAQAGAPLWLEGRCASYGESSPYLPFQRLLRAWVDADVEDATTLAARLRERAEAVLGERGTELYPFLASLLGAGLDREAESTLEPLSPEALQQRITEAAEDLLAGLGERQAVVAALEDLQWADASSLLLLERLLQVSERSAVLVVLTMRPERDSAAWALRQVIERSIPHRMREIDLQPLERGAEGNLLSVLVGDGVLPERLERELIERAEGNPFYLEELARSLVDAGALVRDDGGWRFEREAQVEIPETVEKVILTRVDRLGSEARKALGAAAVLGRQFGIGALEAVVGDGETRDAVRELERHDLVRESRRWPEPEYRFRHSLIRQAVYNSLLKRRRRELHARAAEVIGARLAEGAEDDRGILAYHYGAAGRPAEAFRHHARAARAARRIYASEEAIEHYTAALESAAQIDDAEMSEVARLHLERGMVRWQVGEGETSGDFEAALAGARAAGDRALEMNALNDLAYVTRATDFDAAVRHHSEALRIAEELDDPAGQVRVLNRLSLLYSNRLRFDWAVEVAERALALARPLGDDRVLARAIDSLKLAAHQLGDLPRLERTAAELSEIHRRHGDLWYLQWPLVERALVPIAAARWEEAEARLAEAEEAGRRFGGTLGVMLGETRSRIELARGEYGRALEVAARMARWVQEASAPGAEEWVGWAEATHGSTLLELCAHDAAAKHLQAGFDAGERAGAPNPMLRCVAQLALARRLSGDLEGSATALARAEELLAAITAPPGRTWLWGASAHLAVARVHLLNDEAERASAVVAPIRDAARQVGWRDLVAHASTLLARHHLARGEDEEASRLLGDALDAAPDDRLPGAAWEAHASLAQLEADAGRAGEAARHGARARAIVEHLGGTIDDPRLREVYLAASELALAPA